MTKKQLIKELDAISQRMNGLTWVSADTSPAWICECGAIIPGPGEPA